MTSAAGDHFDGATCVDHCDYSSYTAAWIDDCSAVDADDGFVDFGDCFCLRAFSFGLEKKRR